MMRYEEFLESKRIKVQPSGFDIVKSDLPDSLYEYQKDLVRWAVKRGKAALFTMTGTGKTRMQTTWSDIIQRSTGGNILILAPLAVAKQTIREAAKFGVAVHYCRGMDEVKPGINITNYEMLHHFEPDFSGIVIDESSILKSLSGKVRTAIIQFAKEIPYRLACSATPAPNDYMELGNHAEFLGIMSHTEMLATFFVHDGGDTSKWRLKGHAEEKFWEWMASWAAFLTKPSDLGYSDEGFELPPLHTFEYVVESGPPIDSLFVTEAKGLLERQRARRDSIQQRVEKCAEIVSESRKPFLVWCDLNAESEALTKAIPGAVEITGSDSQEFKEKAMLDFSEGKIDVLVTKPDIAGMGLNWQVCGDMAFVGLSDSFERVFQATRRCWRHGRTEYVNRHIIISDAEGAVVANINRKESDFLRMIGEMVKRTKKITMEEISQLNSEKIEYKPNVRMVIPEWLKAS